MFWFENYNSEVIFIEHLSAERSFNTARDRKASVCNSCNTDVLEVKGIVHYRN